MAWWSTWRLFPFSVDHGTGIHLNRRQYVRLCVVTCLLGTTLCYGAIRVSSARFADGPRLALLQSNIEQKHKNTSKAKTIIAEFTELVDRALGAASRPDLIVWPETSYPYNYITVDPAITPDVLERQVRSIRPQMVGQGVARSDGANRHRSS